MQTRKITRFPIVLVGTEYWSGLLDWIKDRMLSSGKVSPADPELLHLTDDPDEVVQIVMSAHETQERAAQEAAARDAGQAGNGT